MTRSTVGLIVGGLVVVTVLVCVTVLLLHGTEDVVSWVTAGLAGLASLLGVPLAMWLRRDSDGDGVPDIVDDTPRGEP